MVKFGIFSGADLCSILEEEGFVRVRQKGSHAIMQKLLLDTTITVPIPLHNEIKIGTLSSIIRQSGIPKEKFQK